MFGASNVIKKFYVHLVHIVSKILVHCLQYVHITVNNKLISWSINGLSVERGIQGHPDVICFSAPVIILIVQRIRTQELNIFNNVTIENELEWRLNDNNIQTGLATHTKANTVINYGEKYTSKERYHEITAKFKTISRALRFSNQYFTIERARDFLKISNCRSSDLLVQIDTFFR